MKNKNKVEDLEKEKNNSLQLLEDHKKNRLSKKNEIKVFRKHIFHMTKVEQLNQLLSANLSRGKYFFQNLKSFLKKNDKNAKNFIKDSKKNVPKNVQRKFQYVL